MMSVQNWLTKTIMSIKIVSIMSKSEAKRITIAI